MEEKKDIKDTQIQKTKKMRTRVILVLIFLIIVVTFTYISYRGSYLETIEIGENYKEVLTQNLRYRYFTAGISFAIFFIAVSFTNRSIKKGLQEFFDEEKKEMPKLPRKSIAFIISVIASIIISTGLSHKIALCVNNALFGINDPIFNMDIGFYVFQKPLIEAIIIYFIITIISLMIYSTIYYIIVFNYYFDGINAQTLKNSKFIKQITNSIVIVAIGISTLILVTTQGLLTDKFLTLNDDLSTGIYGAGITDVTIKLWGYRILAIILIVSIYISIKAFKNKQSKKAIISILIVPTYLVALFTFILIFKMIYTSQNQFDKEKEYIGYNIENTKAAYNIKIEEIDLNNEDTLKLDEVEQNTELINNISIVDRDITLKTVRVTQTSTGYYSYINSNIGRYNINGKKQTVYISPREIISNGLNRSYNNKTYEYTHGFGSIITSASSVDAAGNIEYLQKDFINTSAIKLKEPRIYFGLETNNTIVTNTSNKSEFDYPTSNSQNAVYSYQGKAGLNLNFIDKLILAVKEKDINLAFSKNIGKDSKILLNRNIIKRAKTIMPNLIYDSNPYLVVDDEGRQLWVIDAYTVTNQYPYSQPMQIEHDNMKEQINYIRNSAKVIIDAYDGTTTFYITDTSDPIIMAYKKIYPSLFSEENIPQDISKHFIYPEFLYNIQANMLERYHNVSTDILYRSDDVWEIAKYSKTTGNTSIKGIKQEPYYTMLKTKDNDEIELGLVIPYTQLDKQSLRAYLVGGYNENGQVKLKLYKFPADSNVLGPKQLDTLLGQDETISKELEALNVTGTKTIKNMIMVPINNTILYVEPIYQQALNETKSVPILKKVIVSSSNKVAIADNLPDAIKNLLSQFAVNIEIQNTDTIEDLVDVIVKANQNLEKSTANNDWEMVGKDLKKLQDSIKKLEILMEEQRKEQEDNRLDNNRIENVVNQIVNNTLSN